MACFYRLEAEQKLVYLDAAKASFIDKDKGINTFFYDKGQLLVVDNCHSKQFIEGRANHYVWLRSIDRSTVIYTGHTLLEFQEKLEEHGGSILMPITTTKNSYVSIRGQKDAD